ncbi:MAG: DNA alkylation repair protein [Bacteroidales bacterium]|nr:DNA alkylation repair protein [Bacteroidales bacterium]
MNKIIDQLRNELRAAADEQSIQALKNFFKEDVKFYGIKNPTTEKIGKEIFKSIKNPSKKEVFELCEQLWQSGYMEESMIACHWSYAVHKQYEPCDFAVFERWISEYVTNWAACDTLCNHTVGDFVMRYPEYLSGLKLMAKSDNRWMRRASAVTLIIPARKGLFLPDIFEIADILLLDRDDLVQKGYGWMLKAASQAHEQEVFEYVISNKAVMPRTALRYAIEKMPAELKAEAMKIR